MKQCDWRQADIVLSDMAAATTGHRQTDHLRTMALLEIALDFAEDVLTQGGTFLAKAFRGGADGDFMTSLNQRFEKSALSETSGKPC